MTTRLKKRLLIINELSESRFFNSIKFDSLTNQISTSKINIKFLILINSHQ